MKRFWGRVWTCWLMYSFTVEARADDWHFAPIHVCVRPPDVPPDIDFWSYWSGKTDLHLTRAEFVKKSYAMPTYVYDPEALPENTKKLPIPYDKLPCDPKPPPAPRAGEAEEAKAAPRPPPSSNAVTKDEASTPPKEPPAPPPREPEEEREWHPRPPEHGVTTDWPSSVLPKKDPVLPPPSVLPNAKDPCASVLPRRGQPPCPQVCTAVPGDGTRPGPKKTTAEKAAEEMAYAAAIFNLQFNEDTRRPDGKPYGIPGGMNPDGPNDPCLQAMASLAMIAVAVLSPGAEAFTKKLASAVTKKTPLLMKEMETVGLDVAEEIAKKLGKGEGEALVRAHLADALEKNGAIGPYEVMKQFTDGLGGRWQAHHILEKKMVKDFGLGNADKVPSVILTEAEHKRITALLNAETVRVRTTQQLWKAYQKVYKDYPRWLEAIAPYFAKVK